MEIKGSICYGGFGRPCPCCLFTLVRTLHKISPEAPRTWRAVKQFRWRHQFTQINLSLGMINDKMFV